MVNLTLDKPYTVHSRSIDRSGSGLTPSQYKLVLRDPITCGDGMYMIATLISAKVPSTFYQIDAKNRAFTVTVNVPAYTEFAKYVSTALETPDAGKSARSDYKVEISVSIKKGNYNIEELLAEIKAKLNAASAALATAGTKFRTFLRGASGSDERIADIADGGLATGYAKDYIEVTPQFDYVYDKHLNKMKLFRTDTGGKLVLGKFDLMTTGMKLSMALGMNHITAQQLKNLGASSSENRMTEASVHYRETSATEVNDFVLPRTAGSPHALHSPSCINMFANDDVYMHISNLSNNAYTTLSQASTTVMAVIPMYSGSAAESFHTPSQPTSTNIGRMVVSELDVKMTDAMGQLIDFNGGEHLFQLLFEAFENGTRSDKPPDANYMAQNVSSTFHEVHRHASQRHAAPKPSRKVRAKPSAPRSAARATHVSGKSHSVM